MNDADYCWWHGYEPVPPGALVCGECFHAFATKTELLEAARRIGDDPDSAEMILFCPLCAHDF